MNPQSSARSTRALDYPEDAAASVKRPIGGQGTMEGKLKIGARVALWGDDPKGKGEIVAGPDELGNWKVCWDEKWDDDSMVSWESITDADEVVVES